MKPIPTFSTKTVPEAHVSDRSRKVTETGSCLVRGHCRKQRGVVLFFTLVALLAMSLAAVALIRSVDTSAMITGNLAYKEQATTSADVGIQAAMGRLAALTIANKVLYPDLDTDAGHPLNQTNLAANRGYYSWFDPDMDVTASSFWEGPMNNYDVVIDSVGNSVYYIIQRMCRISGVPKATADCLLGPSIETGQSLSVKSATQVCPPGASCGTQGQPAQIRITVRSVGPNKSISYVQGFIY